MITATEIAALRSRATDFGETAELKARLAELRRQRQPLCLTASEFEEILHWKLDQQIGRQRALRAANTDELVRAVTGLALTIAHDDKSYEHELRVSILCSLRGVSVPVASAVLALVFPEEYAVIDYRGWRQVSGEHRTAFSVPDYKKYMREIRRLAAELNWLPQEVDHAIWEYDRRQQPQISRHQLDAIRAAQTGESYVLTTGTGSGKSLTYIVPIVDHVLRHGSDNRINRHCSVGSGMGFANTARAIARPAAQRGGHSRPRLRARRTVVAEQRREVD